MKNVCGLEWFIRYRWYKSYAHFDNKSNMIWNDIDTISPPMGNISAESFINKMLQETRKAMFGMQCQITGY